MPDLATIGNIIGALGGAVGIWSAYVTMSRDRAHLSVTIDHRYATATIVDAEVMTRFVDTQAEPNEPRYFTIVTVRNLGNRPTRVEKLIEYYVVPPDPGMIAAHRPLGDLVLTEDRRRYSYAVDMTGTPVTLFAVAARDDRGRDHIASVGKGFVLRLLAKRRIRRYWRRYQSKAAEQLIAGLAQAKEGTVSIPYDAKSQEESAPNPGPQPDDTAGAVPRG